MPTAWVEWNFLPHPDCFDHHENGEGAVSRRLAFEGWAWGERSSLRGCRLSPGGTDLARMAVLRSARCSGDRHTGRLRTLVARLNLHLHVMLLIFELDIPFHLLI